MDLVSNSIKNNVLASVPREIAGAIKLASARTGVDFAYLVKQANAESSFKTDIKAKTSSATGLYQFIESTWLAMIEKYGDKHNIATEGKSRRELLEMRKDPKTASLMAAEFASENERFLDAHWGGEVGPTELYFAHFLGPGQAASFLQARDENPLQQAAAIFPAAARANKNVFYDQSSGRARSIEEVYQFFDGKFSDDSFKVQKEQPALASSVVRRPVNQIAGYDALAEIYGRTPAASISRAFGSENLVADPVEVMLLAQLDNPLAERTEKRHYGNSLYNQ